MSFGDCKRHGERVIKFGECGGGELLARVQNFLRFFVNGFALLGRRLFRPRKIVIHNLTRILVTTFETPASVTHPSHVHCG